MDSYGTVWTLLSLMRPCELLWDCVDSPEPGETVWTLLSLMRPCGLLWDCVDSSEPNETM